MSTGNMKCANYNIFSLQHFITYGFMQAAFKKYNKLRTLSKQVLVESLAVCNNTF